MKPQPCAQVNDQWLRMIAEANDWFAGPLGRQLLEQEQRVLGDELNRCFGSYLVHYGPFSGASVVPPKIKRSVRLGAALAGVEIVCEEQAWPLGEHAADVVLLQHGLDFSLSPHALLREAARSVRPGGHLLIVGINPWSLSGCPSSGVARAVAAGALHSSDTGRGLAQPARICAGESAFRVLLSAAFFERVAIAPAAAGVAGAAFAGAKWRILRPGGA